MKEWRKLRLSLMRRISAVKMTLIPTLLFLFRTIPEIKNDKYFTEWQRQISEYIWEGKKLRIKQNYMQDAVERGGLAVPKVRIY